MIKKGIIPLILVFSFLLLSPQSFGQQREAQPVYLEKISDNLFQVLGGRGANGGFYIGDNGVLVIDSKMTKESVDQTLAEIQKLTDKPIKYLINTHSDGDHIAGNRFFPASVTIFVCDWQAWRSTRFFFWWSWLFPCTLLYWRLKGVLLTIIVVGIGAPFG